MSKQTQVLSTDVLVIGGGIAGLVSANKAADQGVNVLIADKAVVPWTGQVPTSGGGFPTVPLDGIERHVKYVVEEGEYLNDQDWTYAYSRDTQPDVFEMAGWGVPFETGADGEPALGRGGGGLRTARQPTFLPALLGRALSKGVKVLNRVYMVDVLQRNGRAVGAVGLHSETGDLYVIHAKGTIIACGGCNYKARPLFHTNCGEGVAMAYNAGAELRNAEFANTFMISNRFTKMDTRSTAQVMGCMENALGENLIQKYPELEPRTDPRTPPWMGGLFFKRWIRAFYREIVAGRGPIYLNLTSHPELIVGYGDSGTIRDKSHGYVNWMKRLGIDLTKEKVEWTIVPEFHAGPIRVDLNCETTLPGLYATGDAAQNGSAYHGAYEGCGLGGPLGFVTVTGFRAGTAAAKAVATLPAPQSNTSEVNRLKKEIFAPFDVKGEYSPYDAIKEIQEVVFKLRNSFVKREDRLKKALGTIEKVKTRLPELMAKDAHELVRCHEAKAMAICAESLYRASLMRTESRGSNIREDYPERDDKNWLKWIIIKKEKGDMKLWTEPVPIEKYKYKPG
jgi:succinate dehydrogenase / fumarate reductase flavoprotein subunit